MMPCRVLASVPGLLGLWLVLASERPRTELCCVPLVLGFRRSEGACVPRISLSLEDWLFWLQEYGTDYCGGSALHCGVKYIRHYLLMFGWYQSEIFETFYTCA